jgi:ATP-dependent Lon protease
MYTGIWYTNRQYYPGDIVFTNVNVKNYFICTKKHISNDLVFPTKEDIYWIQISSSFLNIFKQNTTFTDGIKGTNRQRSKNPTLYIDTNINTNNNLNKIINLLPTIFEEDTNIIKRKIKDQLLDQNNPYDLRKYKKQKIDNLDDIYIVGKIKDTIDTIDDEEEEEEKEEEQEDKEEIIIQMPCEGKSYQDFVNEENEKYFIQQNEDTFTDGVDRRQGTFTEGIRRQGTFTDGVDRRQGTVEQNIEIDKEIENEENTRFKRKLESLENEIIEHKRMKLYNNEVDNLRDKILLMNIDINTKTFILDKHDNIQKMHGSDFTKGMSWLKTVCDIPYGINRPLNVTKDDHPDIIKEYFNNIKSKLDESIHGLEVVKQEILEFVARKITNPESKGHVLALYGGAGVGKTKLIRTLGQALNLPFYQINFGGLNDVSILTGHSETYIGSKPGKIVEILQNSNCMNPIIYFDEIDKISENKAVEIYGILTHLLDEEQNNHFQDNFLSNINIDLSKVFFVLAFNDITKIDKIVCDRLKVIYIDPPKLEDKITICSEKMIPEILNTIKIKNDINIIIDKEVIEYIILSKTQKEEGVRQLRKNIEKIVNRINYDILVQNNQHFKYENEIGDSSVRQGIIITRSYVDLVLVSSDSNKDYLQMYI